MFCLLPTFLRRIFTTWCGIGINEAADDGPSVAACAHHQVGTPSWHQPSKPNSPPHERKKSCPSRGDMASRRNLTDPLILSAPWQCERGVIARSIDGRQPSARVFFDLQLQPQRRQQQDARPGTRNLDDLLVPSNPSKAPPSPPWSARLVEGGTRALVLDSMRPRLLRRLARSPPLRPHRTNDMSPLTLLAGALRPSGVRHKDHGPTGAA